MPLPVDLIVHRAVRFARGLGFVFLIYFIPVVVRDLVGMKVPGGGWMSLLGGTTESPFLALGAVVLSFVLSVGAVLLYARLGPEAADPLPLVRADRSWWNEWGWGAVLGVLFAGGSVLPAFLTGHLTFQGFRAIERPDVLIALVAVFLMEAAREEFGFRGPAQRELTGALSFPMAAVFLAGSFTLLHLGNPEIGRSGLLGIFFAGLALAGLARARGDVAMACGAHAGWNIALALVYSVPVSGLRSSSALLDVASDADPTWTGGLFGAEASVPGLVVLAVAGFLTWRLPARSGPNDASEPAAGTGGDGDGSPGDVADTSGVE
jgi:membrane protease YdiL (CAAX protease family)